MNIDGDLRGARLRPSRALRASMEPSMNIDGDRRSARVHRLGWRASMEPSMNIDGDTYSCARRPSASGRFNGAVDEHRRRPADGRDAEEPFYLLQWSRR